MNGQTLNLPDGRLGKLLAVAATLLVLAALWLVAVAPVLSWYTTQADYLAMAHMEAAQMEVLKESLPGLRRDVTQTATQLNGTAVLLNGASDAIAGANLQATLSDLAAQAGTTLDSAEAIMAQQTGALRRIDVSVSVTASWPILIAYLAAVDAARPRMVVDDLTVSTNSAPDIRQDVTLQATFTVSAFRAGNAP